MNLKDIYEEIITDIKNMTDEEIIDELINQNCILVKDITINTIWRHFKGDCYVINNIAKNANTHKLLIVYKALYGDYKVWVRELSDFIAEVDINREDNITKQKHRFEKLI